MKKSILYLAVIACVMVMPVGSQAYTINDLVPDSIGYPLYETYGINVSNIYSYPILINLFTNFPPTGNLVGTWNTKPADLFITETYYGNQYQWAIPTFTHDGFNAGSMYAVGTYKISDDFDPSPGSYIYNHNVPVWIDTLGNNYGIMSLAGSITYIGPSGSMPYWQYSINTGIYEDDPNGVLAFTWGTATCANDVITGRVPAPEPTSMLLLGSGLIGLAGIRRKLKV